MNRYRISLIDSGLCNLTSVRHAFEYLGAEVRVISKKQELDGAPLVLPGVGSFSQGMARLRQSGLDEMFKDSVQKGTPILGICLGMQLLYQTGDEFEPTEGLGVLEGEVKKIGFPKKPLQLPHVGWNEVRQVATSCLWEEIEDLSSFYFTHSYVCCGMDSSHVIGTVDYGASLVVAIQKQHIFGMQGHPEKSQKVGLKFLSNFLKATV